MDGAGPEGSPGWAGTGLQPPHSLLPGRQQVLRGSGSPLCPIKRRCRLTTGFSAGSPHTGCGLFSRAAGWGPSPSGPVCLHLESQDVSPAQGCLWILPEPAEGPWVALPGTRDVWGPTLASQGAKTTLRPQTRPQAASPGDRSLR